MRLFTLTFTVGVPTPEETRARHPRVFYGHDLANSPGNCPGWLQGFPQLTTERNRLAVLRVASNVTLVPLG